MTWNSRRLSTGRRPACRWRPEARASSAGRTAAAGRRELQSRRSETETFISEGNVRRQQQTWDQTERHMTQTAQTRLNSWETRGFVRLFSLWLQTPVSDGAFKDKANKQLKVFDFWLNQTNWSLKLMLIKFLLVLSPSATIFSSIWSTPSALGSFTAASEHRRHLNHTQETRQRRGRQLFDQTCSLFLHSRLKYRWIKKKDRKFLQLFGWICVCWKPEDHFLP